MGACIALPHFASPREVLLVLVFVQEVAAVTQNNKWSERERERELGDGLRRAL